MFTVSATGQSRVDWFFMIIGYLKAKSCAVWFNANPDSCFECFEEAWPFILEEMMLRATHAAIEQLQTIVHVSLN